MTTFGDRMEQVMWRYNIKPKTLSEKTGICYNVLYDIRKGKQVPRIQNARKIAEALDVPIEWLYGDKGNGSN